MSQYKIISWLAYLNLPKLSSIAVGLIAIITFIYAVIKYREVGKIESEIFRLEEEFDSIPEKSKNPHVNNDQLTRIIAKKREPLLRKINLLKQKRRFILDKIPLIGLLKK